jgi:hypothetical protein
LGFVDEAYFYGEIQPLWRSRALILNQITFYSDTREGVSPFVGELPHSLLLSDSRQVVHQKLAQYESTRRSYVTDRWTVDQYRLVVAYKKNGGLDSVHIKVPIPALSEKYRIQPKISAAEWVALFGVSPDDTQLKSSLYPLDVAQRLVDEEEEREVEFLDECGLAIYFEDAHKLRLDRVITQSNALVFGAVKFYRARDLNSRQYSGELPLGLSFEDSPEMLFQKIKVPPVKHDDGSTTGRALWHFEQYSLQVLYSIIDNNICRVTLMAPGYWHELSKADTQPSWRAQAE